MRHSFTWHVVEYDMGLCQQFDVALSFGGGDRKYAEALRKILPSNVTCFLDSEFTPEIWWTDLNEFLPDIYLKRARYVIPFLSVNYLRPWPTREKRAALAASLNRSEANMLPVRIDDTEIPGILPSLSVIDLRQHPLEFVRDMLLQKLKLPADILQLSAKQCVGLSVLRFFEHPLCEELGELAFGNDPKSEIRSLVESSMVKAEDGMLRLSKPEHLAPGGAPKEVLYSIGERIRDLGHQYKSGSDSSPLLDQTENILTLIKWATQEDRFEFVIDFFPLLEKSLKCVGDKETLLRLSRLTIDGCERSKHLSPARREEATKSEARAKICGLAWVYQRIDRLDAALQEAGESLKLSEAVRDQRGIAYAHKCIGRLMRMRKQYPESIENLRQAIDEFGRLGGAQDIEVGDSISLLARTHFVRFQELQDSAAFRESQSLWKQADSILEQYPGTKELADCLILWGDMLVAANQTGAYEWYDRAKAQVARDLHPRSEIVARAGKQIGRYFASKNQPSRAISELETSAAIYERLQELENAARCRLIIRQVEAKGQNQGDVFLHFMPLAKSEGAEVGLIAWDNYLGENASYKNAWQRAKEPPSEEYWRDKFDKARREKALRKDAFR